MLAGGFLVESLEDRGDPGFHTEQASPQAPLAEAPPHAGAVEVPAPVGVKTDDLVNTAGRFPREARLIEHVGHG